MVVLLRGPSLHRVSLGLGLLLSRGVRAGASGRLGVAERLVLVISLLAAGQAPVKVYVAQVFGRAFRQRHFVIVVDHPPGRTKVNEKYNESNNYGGALKR